MPLSTGDRLGPYEILTPLGGRLLTTLVPRDSYFNPPGVTDTVTGRTTRIPSENLSDYHSIGWTPEGDVMALKIGLRATIWKFQPVPP